MAFAFGIGASGTTLLQIAIVENSSLSRWPRFTLLTRRKRGMIFKPSEGKRC